MSPTRLTIAIAVSAWLVAGCATTAQSPTASPPTYTVYSDDGVSELSAPGSWTIRPDIGRDAAIRVAADSGDMYLLVNTYLPGELKITSAPELASVLAGNLADNLSDSKVSGPKILAIDGKEAYRYLVSGKTGSAKLVYVSAVVPGSRATHHLIGWVAADTYTGERHPLHRIIASFRESPAPRQAKQRVALSFAWPERFQVTVAMHGKSVKRGELSELKARYLNTVRPGGENELIVSSRVVNQELTGIAGDKGNYLNKVLNQVTNEIPDYVVNRHGEFVRVNDLAGFQQRIERALLSNLPAEARSRKDEILAMVRPGLTQEFLEASILDEWNKTVGGWAESSYVPGETYHFKEEYYAPVLSQAPFPMEVSRQVAGFVPCGDAKRSKCVKLIHTAKVANENFRKSMAQFLQKTLGQAVDIKEVTVLKRMEIIAEPNTLIPHHSLSSEKTTLVIVDGAGKSQSNEETKESRVDYTYDTRTAQAHLAAN